MEIPIKQFIKFGIVGFSNTLISYLLYVFCIYIGLHYILANAIGFFVSVLNAYYWSNLYVFSVEKGKKRNHLTALVKTYVTYGVSELIIASFLLWLYIDYWHISEYIAQLLCLILTVPMNFLINKYWSFNSYITK